MTRSTTDYGKRVDEHFRKSFEIASERLLNRGSSPAWEAELRERERQLRLERSELAREGEIIRRQQAAASSER